MEEMDNRIKEGREILTKLQGAFSGGKNDAIEWMPFDRSLALRECCLFRIKELTFEKEAPRREAMENVLGMFRGMEGVSFIYLILGDEKGVAFYFGVAKDFAYEGEGTLTAPTVGHDILGAGIRGNFRGSMVQELSNEEKKSILERLSDVPHAGILTGVPGTDKDSEDFQGVDRLMDVMSGDDFGFMVIARPASKQEIDDMEAELLSIEESLSSLMRHTLQRTKQQSKSESTSVGKTDTEQNSTGWNKTDSTSCAFTENKNHTYTSSRSNSQQETDGETSSHQFSSGENISDSTNKSNHRVLEKDSSGPKNTIDEGTNSGSGSSVNAQYSAQQQASYVFSYQISEGDNTTRGSQENKSKGESKQENYGHTLVKNESKNTSESTSDSAALMEQMEVEERSATGWVKYIEEVLLPRLDYGKGKGIFVSSAYLFAGSPAMLRRLSSTAISLYSGPKGNKSPLMFHILKEEDAAGLRSLQNMQLPAFRRDEGKKWLTALSCIAKKNVSYAASWLSAEDLSILAALPKKEVPGLALREEVAFGLNVEEACAGEEIPLGNLVQDGVEMSIPVALERSALDKHTFVTGVTGSGKTTTCQNILLGSSLPFLVIEPAKTEYRILMKRCPKLIFFTPGKQEIAPFFLNPFEILPGEAITSRADMIKATLEASFDMEAAIPQIMETAIYRAYEEKGWDIRTNEWRPMINGKDEPRDPFRKGVYPFPTLSDFWDAVKKVTEEEGFGERLQNEYMGSLKARIESLLVGAKGMMLNTPRSLDWNDLIDRQVVIELEEIKNGAEKSLLMGFILTNLMQAVKSRHAIDPNFQHITLVEEAHRLLSRYVPGDSMNKKQGVEVFADMLAEVRKYGESLIIADQIPDKMTPEVLKNTNTKIVHKLFARDDKDAIGDTMALSDEQKAFLSKLPTGRAIIFSQGWTKALQVKVKKEADTTGETITSDVIASIADRYYAENAVIERGVLPGIEFLPGEMSIKKVQDYLWIMRGGHVLKRRYKEIFSDFYNVTLGENMRREIMYIREQAQIDDDVWQTWLYFNLYKEYESEGFARFRRIMEEITAAEEYGAMEQALLLLQREVLGYLRLKN